jgi:protein-disulfide isomerase
LTKATVEPARSSRFSFAPVNAVARRGTIAGVTGTPTFFVNGRKASGMMTIGQFPR